MGEVISLDARRSRNLSISARVTHGKRIHSLGRTSEAVLIWRSVLADDPNNAEANYNIAYVHQLKGQLDSAIEMFKRLIARDERFADAHYNIAVCYMRLHYTELAIRHFDRFIELAPDDPFVDLARNYINTH